MPRQGWPTPHFHPIYFLVQVVQAALLLVRDTLLAFPSAYDALAERLLPPLLSRLHEARTTIRDAAGEAIDTLADSMPPEVRSSA